MKEDTLSYLFDDGLGGDEQLTAETMSFPFIRVLQALSPQCKVSSPSYLETAQEGMLYNNIADELITPPVDVVVGKFERLFIEWKPRRKGFAGAHSPEIVAKLLDTGKLVRGEKNVIFNPANEHTFSDTYSYYILFPEHLDWGVCLLCLSSTQLKEARRWNRLLTTTTIPGTNVRAKLYHTIWTLRTVPMQNDEGSWAGIRIAFKGFVPKETFELVTSERKALVSAAPTDYKALEQGEVIDVIEASTDAETF